MVTMTGWQKRGPTYRARVGDLVMIITNTLDSWTYDVFDKKNGVFVKSSSRFFGRSLEQTQTEAQKFVDGLVRG